MRKKNPDDCPGCFRGYYILLFLSDNIADNLCDVGPGESEFIEKLPSRAAEAEGVLNADFCHLNGTFLGNNLTYRVGEAAYNVMLLNGDNSAGLLGRLGDNLAVNRLDGVDVDKPCVNALCLELLNRLERLVNNKACRDYGNVVALVKGNTLAFVAAFISQWSAGLRTTIPGIARIMPISSTHW